MTGAPPARRGAAPYQRFVDAGLYSSAFSQAEAKVDPDTGYRGYSAEQLGQLNRIVALKELGLSLTQVGQLLGGITLDELRGMLILRRAQLEQELEAHKSQLLGVEARLRYIEREGAMPADDILVKKLPPWAWW